MSTRLAALSASAAADAVVDRLDAGSGPGVVQVRTGAQPATPDTAATGTLLATFTLADPAYGSAASGVAALAGAPRSTTGVAAGTAGWFRALDSTGAAVFDGTVGATGSGAQLEMNTTTVSVGLDLSMTALAYTQPTT